MYMQYKTHIQWSINVNNTDYTNQGRSIEEAILTVSELAEGLLWMELHHQAKSALNINLFM